MKVDASCVKLIEEIIINSTYLKKNEVNPNLEISLIGISVIELPYMVMMIEKKFGIDFLKLVEKERLLNYTILELADIIAKNVLEGK